MSAIDPFAEVDVTGLAAFLLAIPVAEWPAMVDPKWHDIGTRCGVIADELMTHFPGCQRSGVGLFLLAAGQEHPAHKDMQPPEWVTRVHVPVVTNAAATATTDAGTIHMRAGTAYRFDTKATHAVRNGGAEPRVHLVFDVTRKA